jgi:Lar family restriction alleviation protein
MSLDKLKPCPFCGFEDVAVGTRCLHGEVVMAEVACDCGMTGPPAEDENEAKELWNRRHGG